SRASKKPKRRGSRAGCGSSGRWSRSETGTARRDGCTESDTRLRGGPTVGGHRSRGACTAWRQRCLWRAREALSGARGARRLRDHGDHGGSRGRRAGRLHEGVLRDRPLSDGCAVSTLAAADRRRRGQEPPDGGRPSSEGRARIVARGRAPWWSRLPLGPPPLPVAATLLVLIVVLVALPPSAVAFAERVLGVPGIQIFPVPETPSTRPSATATPALFTGTRVSSLVEATQAAGFAVQAPTGLGEPDAIYVDKAPARVPLVYTSRPGIPQSPAVGVSAVVVA